MATSSLATITENELLDAIAAASGGRGPDDVKARTCVELARETGVGERRVRVALQVLKAQGRLRVHRVTRERLDGSAFPCSAYTILPKAKK